MDRTTFENHLKPILPVAYGYALRLNAGHRDNASDLVQDATVAAFRGRETFHSGTNFKAWFFKILTHEHYRRAGRKVVETVDINDAPDVFLYEQVQRNGIAFPDEDPARVVFDQIESSAVREALESLPEDFREACLLYFLAEMSYEDIAATLSVPIGTVRSRLHRGRKQLQLRLWDIARERGIVQGEPEGVRP